MTDKNEIICALWLKSFEGAGDRTLKTLLEEMGSFEAIYKSKDAKALCEIMGISPKARKLAELITTQKSTRSAEEAYAEAENLGISLTVLSSESYPPLLYEIYDPPTLLYYKGNIRAVYAMNAAAVVGSRNADAYGMSVAREFSAEIARRGVGVISGLAMGIDSAAHKGALSVGGITAAVLAGGLNKIFPASNRPLARQILEQDGVLLSEKPPNYPSLPSAFPPRNRIISGLSRLTFVVRATMKSGSLITARSALSQDREVLALPGSILDSLSAGPNSLIKEGAFPVTCPEDIIEVLGCNSAKANHLPVDFLRCPKSFPADVSKEDEPRTAKGEKVMTEEDSIVEAVFSGLNTVDAISGELNMSVAKVASIVTLCELKGKLTANMGKVSAVYRG